MGTTHERRFLPSVQLTPVALAFAVLGCGAMGIGIYALWFSSSAHPRGAWLILGGIALIALALIVARFTRRVVHVGDPGIALFSRKQTVRVPWWQVRAVKVTRGQLSIKTDEHELVLPYAEHGQAAAWILREAERRIPKCVDKPEKKPRKLPKRDVASGKSVRLAQFQTSGVECSASKQLLQDPEEARLCAACGALYHLDHVPEECTKCDRKLGNRAETLK